MTEQSVGAISRMQSIMWMKHRRVTGMERMISNLDVMRREDGDSRSYTFYLKKRRTDAPRTFAAGVSSKNAANGRNF